MKKDKPKKKRRILKAAALVSALLLIAFLAVFANAMIGNPVSKYKAEKSAKKYIAENYSGTDFYAERTSYSFKDGNYIVYIKSPSSEDSSFSVSVNSKGDIVYDRYEEDVTHRGNTARRLDEEYRNLVNDVLDSGKIPYNMPIYYGTLVIYTREIRNMIDSSDIQNKYENAIIQEDLVLDEEYNIRQLAQQAGHICIYVENDVVNIETAKDMLLNIKNILDENQVPFYTIDFTLQYPMSEDKTRPEGSVNITAFLYSDIYEEGLTERIEANCQKTEAYFAQTEKEKQAEIKGN